jgi:hypothetical protein
MDSASRIAVPPTRIAQMGIGTFLVLIGGASLSLCCAGSMLTRNPTRISVQLVSTITYGIMIAFLATAERRSRWVIRDEVREEIRLTFISQSYRPISYQIISDVDSTWLIRIFVGLTVAVGCIVGIFAVFKLNICSTVVAREIVSERDLVIRRRKRKFLF